MLPHTKLKPLYQQISWVYVCRTFKKTEQDLEALRTSERFGVSSWPQLFLVDPKDDRILVRVPRTLDPFINAIQSKLAGWRRPRDRTLGKKLAKAKAMHAKGKRKLARKLLERLAKKPDPFQVWLEARELLRRWGYQKPGSLATRLDDPDPRVRALALEQLSGGGNKKGTKSRPNKKLVRKVQALLFDDQQDVVVRIRALRFLHKVDPQGVLKGVGPLLKIQNDPFLYEVLGLIKQHPDPRLSPTLAARFQNPSGSKNPNVLRISLANCLVGSGDLDALEALAEPARKADPRNGLTTAVIRALGGIGSRAKKRGKLKVLSLLIESLPPAARDTRTERMHLNVAKEVLKAWSQVVPRSRPRAPSSWGEAERSRVERELRALLR